MNFNKLKCKVIAFGLKLYIQFRNFCMKWYIRFKGRPYLLDKAVRKAGRLHRKTGRRYRVFFFGYKYQVWDRQRIKEQKRIGLLKRDRKVGEDFDRICFYDTQNPDRHVCQ